MRVCNTFYFCSPLWGKADFKIQIRQILSWISRFSCHVLIDNHIVSFSEPPGQAVCAISCCCGNNRDALSLEIHFLQNCVLSCCHLKAQCLFRREPRFDVFDLGLSCFKSLNCFWIMWNWKSHACLFFFFF